VQLKRLPSLAMRNGSVLQVSLFPSGTATFSDTEALDGGRTFSLWDAYSEINAVLLYTTDGDTIGFRLLQRTTGRVVELPSEPACPRTGSVWSPPISARRDAATNWPCGASRAMAFAGTRMVAAIDMGRRHATWKDPDTIVVEYATAAGAAPATLERRLSDAGWRRTGAS